MPQLFGYEALVPSVAAHDVSFEGGDIRRMGGIERTVRDARCVRRRRKRRRRMHGRTALAPVGGDVLHARGEVSLVVARELDALVLLRVGQARVHGKREGRVVANGVERVGVAAPPSLLKREQQAQTRDIPCRLVEDVSKRLEALAVFHEAVARNYQTARFNPLFLELAGERIGLHHAIGAQAMRARLVQVESGGIDFLAHGIRDDEHVAAHARRLRAERHRIERGDADERHAERLGYALGSRHRDADPRKGTGTAPHAHAADRLAGKTGLPHQLVDARDEPRVRGAMRAHLAARHRLDRLRSAVQPAQRNRHDLVGRVERQDVPALQRTVAAFARGFGRISKRARPLVDVAPLLAPGARRLAR